MNTRQLTLNCTAVFIATALSACASTGGYGQPERASTGYGYGKSKAAAEEEAAPVEPAKTVTVNISNFAFEPASITLSSGDTVVFVNQDGAPHTATSTNGAFDTGNLANGQSGSVTLTSAGSFDYFCAIHPAMKGTIVVQ